ncbi:MULTISPECIES: glycosyltransferase [Methanosarcina]|uniref:TPR/glycosyl transferase domain protein n=1 Tax=Methanosarcina barkeri MS TaxID=1434108 RepID=A0A0E3LMX7_METBA|nr:MULTISPECIES: glycosyltransferase [Methanosarcina]AKB53791.1 TPR/glycosyl transferase domain protein [Methanosarcina barkeri MS]
MKKVLIVSYYFPPDPAIGGLRINGLAKYLPDFGWEPVILTKNSPDNFTLKYTIVRTPYCEYDSINSFKNMFGLNPKSSFKGQLGRSTLKDKKTFLYLLSNFITEIITYPDNQKKWYSDAFKIGDELLTNEKIDAIISSSSPIISHIIAHDLSEKYNIPWIADLRDLWTQNHYCTHSKIRKVFDKRLELKTLAASDAITTVSSNLASNLRKFHNRKSVYSIPNGYDLEESINTNISLSNKFTITYTGSLYNGKRDPSKLFNALNELIKEKKIDRKNIEIRFYGPKEEWIKEEIKKYSLQDIISHNGLVSRDISLVKQKESQLLLLLLWDHPSEIGVYTGKLFEYLASKRPILAIGGPKGVVNDLLEETETGYFVSSVEDIKNTIIKYYTEYKLNGQVSYKGNNSKIEKYSQKEMARKFADILDNFIKVDY